MAILNYLRATQNLQNLISYRSGIGRRDTDPTESNALPTIYTANEYNIVLKFPHHPSETMALKTQAKNIRAEYAWKIIVAVSLLKSSFCVKYNVKTATKSRKLIIRDFLICLLKFHDMNKFVYKFRHSVVDNTCKFHHYVYFLNISSTYL